MSVDAGPQATAWFLEFFAGTIANARTRAAYGRAVGQFLGWCEARGLGLRESRRSTWPPTSGPTPVGPRGEAAPRRDPHVLRLARRQPSPPVNPAAAVRGPKHIVTKGATPVLSPGEARKLLESTGTGLRESGSELGCPAQPSLRG